MSVAVSLGLTLLAAAADPAVFAMHIGVNASPPGTALTPLSYADDDAARLYMLTNALAEEAALVTTLDPLSQRRFPDAAPAALPPTTDAVQRALADMRLPMHRARRSGRKVVFIFSYSGHGTRGSEGTELTLLDSKIDRAFLEAQVASLPADAVHLWLDACHAGGMVKDRGFKERDAEGRRLAQREADLALGLGFFQRYPHVGALIATSADGPAHEWSELEAGVFTYELASGLAGAADVNLDGSVDYSEMGAFIAAANRAIEDPLGRVALEVEPPRQNQAEALVRRDWFRGGATLIHNGPAGQLTIGRADGLRLFDAHPGPDQPLAIWVPAEVPLLVQVDRSKRARLSARAGERVRTRGLRFAPAPAVHERGVGLSDALQQGFFSRPYGKAYYEGYVDSRRLLRVRFEPPPDWLLDDETDSSMAPGHERPPATDDQHGDEDVDELYNPVEEDRRAKKPATKRKQLLADAERIERGDGPRVKKMVRVPRQRQSSGVTALRFLGVVALGGAATLTALPTLYIGALAASNQLEAITTSLPMRRQTVGNLALGYGAIALGGTAIALGLAASAGLLWYVTGPDDE